MGLCKLIQKQEIASNIFDFVVETHTGLQANAGQFLHVKCGGTAYLRRPISICDAWDDKLRFIFEVRGEGTRLLSQFRVGETIDILGPLGRGFDLDLAQGDGDIILVGGGIGTFPLLLLARELELRVKKPIAILGYRTKELITLTDEFEAVCEEVKITTDDGSHGTHGFVTDVLADMAKNGKISAIYTCGPTGMMKAVAKIAIEHNIPAQVSMEERMACGIGACVTCTCSVAGYNARVCKDGPVFNAEMVDWGGF
ncbi:MAG: dihydroorotate dehydrogenase electron transfer subunit [Oscillospiraceae bacterium]|nr:dihydroorotate dehydrogenase electron transfer subunit [Oscillospiraceae bacterium]